MTPGELFNEVLNELEERLTEPTTHYKLLRAAGLIRLLLTDRQPLADQVVEMKTAEFVVHVPMSAVLVAESHDPLGGLSGGMYLGSRIQPRGGPTTALSREDFLGFRVASSSWTGQITVKDVVRAATIAFGGIHLMTPTELRDQKIAETIRMLGDGDLTDLTGHVAEIGHIALAALREARRIQE